MHKSRKGISLGYKWITNVEEQKFIKETEVAEYKYGNEFWKQLYDIK